MATWQKVQGRSINQPRSRRGHQRRPAATELARDIVSKWGWEIDTSTGELRDGAKRVTAGCIEDVADAMQTSGYFTFDDAGHTTGVNWLSEDEKSLVRKLAAP